MEDKQSNVSRSSGLSTGPALARKQSVPTSTFKNHPFLGGGPKIGKAKSKDDSNYNEDSNSTVFQKPHKPASDRHERLSSMNAHADENLLSLKPDSSQEFTDHVPSTSPSMKQATTSESPHGKGENPNATILSTDEIKQAIESKAKDFTSSHSILTRQMLSRAAYRSELGLLEPSFGENLESIRGGPAPMTERRMIQEKSPFAALKPLNMKENATSTSTSKANSDAGSVIVSSETSNKRSKKKTIRCARIQSTKYKADATDLPLYYHHTALPRSLLAPNNRILTSWPPAVEDKAAKDSTWDPVVEELQELFPDEVQNARPQTLQQREKAKQLWPFVEKAFRQLGITQSHILSFFEKGLDETTMQANHIRRKDVQSHRQWFDDDNTYKDLIEWARRRIENDQSPTSETQRLNAFMACNALWNTVDLPMHNFERVRARGGESAAPKTMTSSEFYGSRSCSVCQLIECPYHGEYLEDCSDLEPDAAIFGDQEGAKTVNEVQADLVNRRLRMNASLLETAQPQMKLAYTSALSFDEQLGLDTDGEARGRWNGSHEHDRDAGYEDDELCSDKCFWKKSNRTILSTEEWSEEDVKYLEHILPGFSESKRGPCFLAIGLEKPCIEVYFKVRVLSSKYRPPTAQNKETERSNQKRSLTYWLNNSETALLHQRLPFYPCHHPNSTCEEEECRCYSQNINCEKSCRCSPTCSRRFRGCKCVRAGNICWKSSKCDCFRLNRECDADLCGTCGAAEILDPMNRHDPAILTKQCANVSLQRNVPRCTRLGISQVSGFGLFMGEPTKRGQFIGEYKGHLMSAPETHRRSSVYQYGELTYLFRLTSAANTETETERGHEIDGMLAGSKTRFINNSRLNKNINVVVKLLLANQIVRLAMFAGRDIEPGEELFFDYQLPEDHHSKLWEMGEQSNDITAARRQLIWGQSATAIGGPLPSGAAGLTNDATSRKKRKPEDHGLQQPARRQAGENDTVPKDKGKKSGKGKRKSNAVHGEDPNRALEASDYDDFQSFFEDPVLLQQISDSNDDDYREAGESSTVEYTPRKLERTRRLRTRKNFENGASNDWLDGERLWAGRKSSSFASPIKRKSAHDLDEHLKKNQADDSEDLEHEFSSRHAIKRSSATKKARSAKAGLNTTSASKPSPAHIEREILSTSDIEAETSTSNADGETSERAREEATREDEKSRKGMARKQARPWPKLSPSSGTARKEPPVSEAPTFANDNSETEINRPSVEPKTTTKSSNKRKKGVADGLHERRVRQKPKRKPKASLHRDSDVSRGHARSFASEKTKKNRKPPISSRLKEAGFTGSDLPLSSSDSEIDASNPPPAKTQRELSTTHTPAREMSRPANLDGTSANSYEHSSQLCSTGDSSLSSNYRRIVIEETGSECSNRGAFDHEAIEDEGKFEDLESPCKGRKRKWSEDEGLHSPRCGPQKLTKSAEIDEMKEVYLKRRVQKGNDVTGSHVSNSIPKGRMTSGNHTKETDVIRGGSLKRHKKSSEGTPAKKTKMNGNGGNITSNRASKRAPRRRGVE